MGVHGIYIDADIAEQFEYKGHTKARASDIDGGGIGASLGYNWSQGSMFYGIVGDYSILDADTTRSGGDHVQWSKTTGVESLATARLRLGLTSHRWLLYATGGIAAAELSHSKSFLHHDKFYSSRDEDWAFGWTYGGGLEYALSSKWRLKSEYLYVDLDDEANVKHGSGRRETSGKLDGDLHVFKVGVGYQF